MSAIPTPPDGDAMLSPRPSPETLALLAQRRSTRVRSMTSPGPNRETLDGLLRLAARVPDHGKLTPWRFVVIEGEARGRLGAVAARRKAELEPDMDTAHCEAEAARFQRAPVVVAVASTARPHRKIPEWEQILSAGAVCQNLLIAAHAASFAAQWLTEWPAYDEVVKDALGLAPDDRIAGFIYLGTATEPSDERARPALDAIVTRLDG